MARIVCLGSALQDLYMIDKKNFGPDPSNSLHFKNIEISNKIDIERASYKLGGGGSNTAMTFARHGHEAVLFANIAHDMAGDAIIGRLDHENVDTRYVQRDTGMQTGLSVILLDKKRGERTILTYRGVSAHFENFKAENLE